MQEESVGVEMKILQVQRIPEVEAAVFGMTQVLVVEADLV
jgi:hypothetical protein